MRKKRCTSCTKNPYSQLTDLELLQRIRKPSSDWEYQRAYAALYERYQPLIHKNWWKFLQQLDNSSVARAKEQDYYSAADEAFVTAVSKVDLSKIYDNNWKLVGLARFYVMNARNNLVKETIREFNTMKSLDHMQKIKGEDGLIVDADVEESYWRDNAEKIEPTAVYERKYFLEACTSIIQDYKKSLAPRESDILTLYIERKSRKDIAKVMNCTEEYINSFLFKVRRDIKKNYEKDFKLLMSTST